MELNEKLGYVAMLFLATLGAGYATTIGYAGGLADTLVDLMPWFVMVWLVLLGLALLLFALDGLAGGMVPDSLAPLVAWLVVLLEGVLIVVMAVLNQLEL